MVKYLVADSGAFIKAVPLENWSLHVLTVKEVVAEVKDENTRRRLQVLPYELQVKEPSQAALQHVTGFAKKTGDYGSLSAVDIKVMALTYQLTCEHEPGKCAQFREQPSRDEPASERVSMPGVVGFYTRAKEGVSEEQLVESSEEVASEEMVVESRKEVAVEEVASEGVAVQSSEEVAREEMAVESSEEVASEGVAVESSEEVASEGVAVQSSEEVAREEELVGSCEEESIPVEGLLNESGEEDEDGWINPENFEEACLEMGGALEESAVDVQVGCLTTDFAMQNVLLQMGLTVLSVEGLRVKQLRTYAKKCKACFKTTTNSGLLFCPHCGNKTLAKVVVTVGQDGTLRYSFLGKKQFSRKGLRYSLPAPKSGRHANNPVLAPDQRVTYKGRRSRQGKVDALHPDYIAQSSPFAWNDVTSKGAQVFFREGRNGGRRQNPNVVRPKLKRK